MRDWLKNRKVLAGAVLVALLVLTAMWPRAVPVDLAAAQRGPLQVTVDEEGQTRVHDRFVVSAPVAGRVLRIELEPGDRVKRGETVLATFQPGDPNPLDVRSRKEAEESLRSAEAALAQVRANAEFARSDAERYRKLGADGIVSRELQETKETAARTAEAAEAEAEHRRSMAAARLMQARPARVSSETITIRSPIDGVVLRRLRESESVVPAGEPLLEVADPKNLEIVSDYLSTEAVKIRPSNPVLVERWGGDNIVKGRVRLVEPYGFLKISALGVEEQRVNVIVDFSDPQEAWRQLGDGYRVELRVVVWEAPDVLQVPTSSLFRRGDNWAVFTVRDGKAKMQPVEVGRRNGLMAQILSGLQAGEQVILHPSDSVGDGARVSARPPEGKV